LTAKLEASLSKAAEETADPTPYALQAAAVAAANAAREAVPSQAKSPRNPAAQQPAKPKSPERAVQKPAAQQKVSYPASEPVSPLLAGLIGMLLGALFATILFSGRRILDSLRKQEWTGEDASATFNAFDTTDTLDVNVRDAALTSSDPDITQQGTAPVNQYDDLDPEELKPARQYLTDELAAASPFGTIEVEFSELNAMQGKTLGFDLSEALSDTPEQPKLGESPRINLEGLGNNFDLNRELREMLEEFAPEERSAAANSSAETSLSTTDIDYDLEDTGEVTQPRLDEQTGAHDEQDSYESEAAQTVAIKPFSMGLDLDLGLHNPQQPLDELDFSLDEEIDQAAAQKDSDDTRD
jgi:hypothetical protein